ncbi:hypothetical protein [Streptomyces sp. BE133]|uniref:hypothetical protein n=1 Tax=Streptomyces sp. BE133 TaxID=3002523 RepID=UPI002E7865DB|nr:hypothetical protein [Streptomyces sp. BE133]MEE1807573.1 hypothetical protein [Streptomyces sp. BE133]
MSAGWCSRTIRAAVFAAVCVLLAALGHVMMSGSSVPAWALAAGVAVTGAVGWCLAGRERGLPMVVAVVVAAQTALHWAFSLAQSASGGSASTDMSDMGSMHMSMDMGSMQMDSMDMTHMDMTHMDMTHMDMTHMDMTHMDMTHMDMTHMDMGHMDMGHMSMGHMDHMTHMGHSMDGGGSSSFGMLAAHLLAALLTGLWLACGEKAAFRILRAVAGWLAAPLRLLLALPAAPGGPRVRLACPRSNRAPSLLLLAYAISSRGPPVGTVVA